LCLPVFCTKKLGCVPKRGGGAVVLVLMLVCTRQATSQVRQVGDLYEERSSATQRQQGTRNPTTARKKSVLSVVFTSDVYVKKQNPSGVRASGAG
jgi:hypothetical protein